MTSSAELRARVDRARLLLCFTPELCGDRDPLAVLEALLPHVDLIQVRPKPVGDRAPDAPAAATVTQARAAFDLTRQVLERVRTSGDPDLPVMVNDRVDVAKALEAEGAAGVHVGDADCPPEVAREFLGGDALIGLSTHSFEEVLGAEEQPVDLLGFGPVFPTATKGYDGRGLAGRPAQVGPEKAWIASEAAPVPLFPIGGIDLVTAGELEEVGRAAVSSVLLSAVDPGASALALRQALGG